MCDHDICDILLTCTRNARFYTFWSTTEPNREISWLNVTGTSNQINFPVRFCQLVTQRFSSRQVSHAQERSVVIRASRNWINGTFRSRANLRAGFVSRVKCRVKWRGAYRRRNRKAYLTTLKSAPRVKWLEIYPIPLIQSNKSYLTAGAHATFAGWKVRVPNFWTTSKKNKFEKSKGARWPPRGWSIGFRLLTIMRFSHRINFTASVRLTASQSTWPTCRYGCTVMLQTIANHVARYRKIFDKLASSQYCHSLDKWNIFQFQEARCTFAYPENGNRTLQRVSWVRYAHSKKRRTQFHLKEISNFISINCWATFESYIYIRSDFPIYYLKPLRFHVTIEKIRTIARGRWLIRNTISACRETGIPGKHTWEMKMKSRRASHFPVYCWKRFDLN